MLHTHLPWLIYKCQIHMVSITHLRGCTSRYKHCRSSLNRKATRIANNPEAYRWRTLPSIKRTSHRHFHNSHHHSQTSRSHQIGACNLCRIPCMKSVSHKSSSLLDTKHTCLQRKECRSHMHCTHLPPRQMSQGTRCSQSQCTDRNYCRTPRTHY